MSKNREIKEKRKDRKNSENKEGRNLTIDRKKIFVAGYIVMALAVTMVTMLTFNDILALRGDENADMQRTDSEDGERTDSEDGERTDSADGAEAVRTAADGNWGLSFQKDGTSPVGNASADYLKQFNAYYIGAESGKEKTIYLTFDAGYENGYTAGILDILKEEKVPAAFFVVGNFVEENPELVKRMTQEGHIVGNHTMHHPDMSAIADEAGFRKEMKELEETYKAAAGEEMLKYYRPPQGKYSESNLTMARDMGYTTVFWSLAYVDWLQDSQPSKEDAMDILNRRIHPGAIVLLHSTSKTNSEILQELIQGWKAEGYTFKPISELGIKKF